MTASSALKAMVEAMATNEELELAKDHFVKVSRDGLTVMGATFAAALTEAGRRIAPMIDEILKESRMTAKLNPGAFYWVRPAPGVDWEPAQFMDGAFVFLGTRDDGPAAEVGPELTPPNDA